MPDKIKVLSDVVYAILKHKMTLGHTADEWIAEISQAYDDGRLFYIYDGDVLQGFLQAFRVPRVPTSQEDALEMFKRANHPHGEGKIGVIINCIVLGGSNTLWRLAAKLNRLHPTWDKVVWYNRKTGKFVEHNNMRSVKCREIVES